MNWEWHFATYPWCYLWLGWWCLHCTVTLRVQCSWCQNVQVQGNHNRFRNFRQHNSLTNYFIRKKSGKLCFSKFIVWNFFLSYHKRWIFYLSLFSFKVISLFPNTDTNQAAKHQVLLHHIALINWRQTNQCSHLSDLSNNPHGESFYSQSQSMNGKMLYGDYNNKGKIPSCV